MSAKTTVKLMPGALAAPVQRRLVLASTSRYRRMLLERLAIPFIAVAPGTDEAALAEETPAATAFRLAEAKARSIAGTHPDALIIGSDQLPDFDGRPIGKPGTHEGAVAQLQFEETLLEHHALTAPFDALVVARLQELGAVVRAGQSIFEIEPDEVVVEESMEARAGRRKRVTLAALAD